MAGPRTFAALLDQDSVVVLEFQQEKAGFRLIDTRSRRQRFTSPEAAADGVVALLEELRAKNGSVAIVLQHFGSFFHTLVLPPAAPEHTRQIIEREVQRSFNIADPAIAFAAGPNVERRDASRAGGQTPRQVFIAGAPRSVVDAIQARMAKTRLRVEGLTVVPEVFRRLYDTLDGSTEATAVLLCLQNGPHVAFFVNGRLELAIEPPLALDGEAPLDTTVIIDQLERGAIFLRQQARGTVATRLLLSAPAEDYESLSSTIEARTGMHVVELGRAVGTPEAVVAMGAVLAARGEDRLDLFPRPPAFEERLKTAMSGPGLVTSTMMAAAAVVAFWAGMQLLGLRRTQSEVERLQAQVERTLPAVANARESARGRERISGIRSTLRAASLERTTLAGLMGRISAAPQSGTQLDSIQVTRVREGLETRLYGHASAPTGPAAMGAATSFYRHFKADGSLKNFEFDSSYGTRQAAGTPAATSAAPGEDLHFTISFLAPAGEG
jgi:hypothetical protein